MMMMKTLLTPTKVKQFSERFEQGYYSPDSTAIQRCQAMKQPLSSTKQKDRKSRSVFLFVFVVVRDYSTFLTQWLLEPRCICVVLDESECPGEQDSHLSEHNTYM